MFWDLIVSRTRDGAALLRRLLRLRPPTSQQNKEALRDQASLLFSLSMLFAVTGIGNTIFIVLNFEPLDRPLLPVIGAVIVTIYGLIVTASLIWRRTDNAFGYLQWARLLYSALGIGWGALINALAHYGTVDQRALIIGLALGVVSTPIICVPAIVAFSFFVPVALLSVVAVTLLGIADTVTTVAFGSYTVFAIVGIICTNIAFDGRSKAQAALRREVATVNIFLREYQEGSSDWLWETDAVGRLTSVPASLAAIVDSKAAIRREWRLDTLFRATEKSTNHSQLTNYLKQHLAFRDVTATARVGSKQLWFNLTGHPVHSGDGHMSGFRGIGRDITERYEADLKLAFLAKHDGLTGLLNRKEFVGRVAKFCEEGRRFVLASIDLDNFKKTNDTYGHHLGDELLVTVANRIKSALRPSDEGGRLGGDEFAVLIADADLEKGATASVRLSELIAERLVFRGHSVTPSASIGVAALEDTADDASRLFFKADLALYRAKAEGKGAVRRFTSDLEDEYEARLVQEGELAAAIDNGEITVAYQPIADLFTGQVLCLEALARWHHPQRGQVSPATFIPVAETSGLIDRLGELILRESLKRAAQWPSTVQVNVNLSPQQLVSGQFPTVLATILRETGLLPARVGIEITENIFVDFSKSVLDQLSAIKAQGIRLVLDDFGTGYSSLSYLQMVDVDGLKIDASFLRQLPDRKVEAIIRTVTRLTADLNIHLVAEGVENALQLQWLRTNGVHFGQGFLLGRPKDNPPLDWIDHLP
ncbi:putative bifunctional diguanylate cyclase/phosphodiesterase [Aureimonas glaciei]|uniref:GGDEF domain-containing protein n=1 Tax=Aureimonas glaciei TaxID=1776957 RepID=A0A916Y8S5_9HYPH|nr:EAL domain-containing protein [Aureimonas glaciei]GGD34528.1 GGDEF domain-containing protein [Aureimonas glaciei]